MKTKKMQQQILPHWAFNSLPRPFGYNSLLSEPLRQVLLEKAKITGMVMLY